MDFNHKMERFSFAMTSAVCAQAGCTWDEPSYDDGVDLIVHGNSWKRKPQINIQLKSTHNYKILDRKSSSVKYPLSVKNYHDLIDDTFVPQILVLALIPPNESCWVKQTERQVSLGYSLYYTYLRGQSPTNNNSTVTVPIPELNRFTADTLKDLMSRVANKGVL